MKIVTKHWFAIIWIGMVVLTISGFLIKFLEIIGEQMNDFTSIIGGILIMLISNLLMGMFTFGIIYVNFKEEIQNE